MSQMKMTIIPKKVAKLKIQKPTKNIGLKKTQKQKMWDYTTRI